MKTNKTSISSRLIILNFIFLVLGNLAFYFSQINTGLSLVLFSSILLLFILFLNFKSNFAFILLSFFFILIFTFNAIENGLAINELIFFVISHILLMSLNQNLKIPNFSITVIYRLSFIFLFLYVYLLVTERLNFNINSLQIVFDNPNTFAVSILAPFLLFLSASNIVLKKSKLYKFLGLIFYISCMVLLFYSFSRTCLIILLITPLFIYRPVINKISLKMLFFIYLMPITLPILAFSFYMYTSDSYFMTEFGIYRDVWILAYENFSQLNFLYDDSYGLNSIIYGVNNFGILYLVYFLLLGYIIFFKNSQYVTRSLVLFTLIGLIDVFESIVMSGHYGFVFFKILLLVLHFHEQKQIKNKYCNTYL